MYRYNHIENFYIFASLIINVQAYEIPKYQESIGCVAGVATEIYNDVLFVSENNENVWWYDGERIAFRTPNYTKILNAMRTEPTLTLADMKEITGISIAAIQKLLDQLIRKKYVERGEKDGSWRVFVTQ